MFNVRLLPGTNCILWNASGERSLQQGPDSAVPVEHCWKSGEKKEEAERRGLSLRYVLKVLWHGLDVQLF